MDLVASKYTLSGVTLVRDCLEADGNFLVCACLKSALQAGRKVVLLTLKKGASHYAGVMRKMGANLERYKHQVVMLDPLASALRPDATLACDLTSLSAAIEQACGLGAVVTPTPHAHPTVVLIDSISGLAALHAAAGPAWMDFLRRTVQLVSEHPERVALALVAHTDVAGDTAWTGWLAAASDCVVTVDPLPTGLAADVNVKVSVVRPNRWGCAYGLPQAHPDPPSAEISSTCFGSVTERSVQFRHSSAT